MIPRRALLVDLLHWLHCQSFVRQIRTSGLQIQTPPLDLLFIFIFLVPLYTHQLTLLIVMAKSNKYLLQNSTGS
jgi:hypothetical protein